MRKKRVRKKSAPRVPTYAELADLVAELTEINIANVDSPHGDEHRFVSCFTYGPVMPDHWDRAIAAREALIASRIIERQVRSRRNVKLRRLR